MLIYLDIVGAIALLSIVAAAVGFFVPLPAQLERLIDLGIIASYFAVIVGAALGFGGVLD